MILIFGGTTEGRIAVKTLDEGEGNYFYSTLGETQQIECAHGNHIIGEMNETDVDLFSRKNNIRLIIDAAHPFAEKLHKMLSLFSSRSGIPIIRIDRQFPDIVNPIVVMCDDFEDAVSKLKAEGINKLLALSGVNTITKTKKFWQIHDTYFRILGRKESIEKAVEIGFPKEKLCFYEKDNLNELIEKLSPDAILTKESGESGGFEEKLNVAINKKIPLYVIKRPPTPDNFITVTGPHSLRREIERILPDFFPLHSGLTTGSCATVAAKAALFGLLTGVKLREISFRIPEGETMKMEVENVEINENSAIATVIKDAGDDPDVTDGCRIKAEISFSEIPGIKFIGGKGIGKVTLPGLGLAVGEPAINPIPRQMITDELRKLYPGGLNLVLSIENGEELAKKTFNPKIGIEGGLSIIGTSGIVRPFSHEAFIESIRRQLNVAVSMNCERIVINSGGKSEGYMKKIYADLPSQSFIHYGNAVGETLSIAQEIGIKNLSIGMMLGKAVKLAEGHLDTHSHKITFNRELLKQIAEETGCSRESIDNVNSLNLARELTEKILPEDSDKFFKKLLSLCLSHCKNIFHNSLHSFLIADDGKILADLKS